MSNPSVNPLFDSLSSMSFNFESPGFGWIIPAEVEKDEKGRRPSGASNQGARRATPQPGSEQILW